MLEGLEAVEISYKESISTDNETFRFDSEYFQKKLLKDIGQLRKIPHENLAEISEVKGGKRLPLGDDFVESGIRYIRAEDVKNSFVQFKNSPFISEKTHSEIATYQTSKNDVLLTIVGNSIGDIGIVKFDLDKCNLTENCVKIVSKKSLPFFSDYLFLFLMSHYGQVQIAREKVGTAQPKLAIERIRRFIVPAVNINFQERISNILFSANNLLIQKDNAYVDAETLLLEALGLTNFMPSTEAVNTKSFKESFGATGRLDAEYYQPKYEHIVAHIAAQPHDKLGALVDIQKSIEPGSDVYSEDAEGLSFLRVADYSKQGITTPQVRLNDKFVNENAEKLESLKPKQDTILLSKDGSVGEAYRLREDANFITSGAILHLTVKDKNRVLPDYLTLVLNSIVVKQQAERDAGGSIILHWRKEEIENVLVPIIDKATQQKITTHIQKSFKLKAESERLLEVAKRAVEIAIEENEEAALEYIGSMS